MPVVQCPNCDKKLNLREPKPGKKLRCPGCEEPFTPFPAKGAGKPVRKKRAAPVDDFDDEDDFDEPAPRRKKSPSGKKGGAKKGGKKGKSAAGGKKSKLPLFIGVGVLGVALAGGVTFMLMSANSDTDGSTAAAPASSPAGAAPDAGQGAAAGGHNAEAGGHGADDGGHGAPAAGLANGAAGGGDVQTQTNTASSAAGMAPIPGNISLQWIPQQAEAMVFLDIDRLLSGPVNSMLQSPFVSGPIQQFKATAGFGPEDIQSITIGVAGVSQMMTPGQAPPSQPPPFVAVIRAKRSIDSAKIQAAIPGAQSINDAGLSYLRMPGNPPMALWFADETTAVFGAEPDVRVATTSTSPPLTIDTALLDGKSVIQAVFSPRDVSVFQHPQFQAPPQSPPSARVMVEAIRQHATAAGLAFDLTNDIGFSMAVRCRDSAGALAVAAAFQQSNDETKAQAQAMADNPAAAMMGPMLDISKQMGENNQIITTDTISRSIATAEGGGQQLVAFVPVMIGQLMAQGMMQGGPGGSGRGGQNNLKTLGVAMQYFHNGYKRFPNPAPKSPTGVELLSWRVHLLPFLGQEALYEKFKLDEPWDSANNRPLADQMPDIYRSTNAVGVPSGMTLFQVPIGPGTAFEGAKGLSMQDFTDGTSNTILIVETSENRAVYWTQPRDFVYDPQKPLDGLGGVRTDGFEAVLADGSTKTISLATDAAAVAGMFTRNGGEQN